MMRASTPEIRPEVHAFADDIRDALAACALSVVPDAGASRTPTRPLSVEALRIWRPKAGG
jgi:hypothetical protein